jgi:L-arabinose isomerase
VVWKPVLTDADASSARCSTPTPTDACVGVIAWMHTFSPAKMWIAGLDALRKPAAAPAHPGEPSLPWSTIDMDFMNLNQAAHGDREFGYIQTRMGSRARPSPARRDPRVPSGSALGRAARLARAGAAAGPLRRQHARRRRDRGRQGRGPVRFGRLGQHLRRQRPRRACRRGPTPTSTPGREYDDATTSSPELRRGGSATTRCATAPASRRACAVPRDGGFGAFTTNFEDLGGCGSCPAWPSSG